MTETEKTFTDGLSFFLPRDNAPEFVKGALWIEPKRFVEFMKANQDKMIDGKDRDGNPTKIFKVDLKIGQSGKSYAELNTWKPEAKPEAAVGEDAAW